MIFDEVKLKDIATIFNGRAYKQNELLENGKYKVLRVGNFFTSDSWYFSNLELDENKYCNFGDLLFAWSANFGPKIWNEGKTIFHYHIWKIELKENIDKNYLFYYLKFITDKLKNSTHGSVMMHLTKVDMENQIIKLPDYNNQKKIGEILSKIDEKIELNNKINDNLLELSQQLFFKYFCNDDKTNFVKEVTLKEFCNIKYGKGLPTKNILTEGFPVYGGNGIIGFYNQKMYDESQVLVSCRGAASGKVIFTKPKCFVTNNSLVLECDRKYYYYLKELSLRNPYYSYTTGSAQPQITIDNIKDINIKVPSDDVLNEYNSIAEQIEKKYFMNIDQNETLEQLRDTLLPKLMSGEIDLDKIEI